MSSNARVIPSVVDAVELLHAELRRLRSSRSKFKIYHRFRHPGTLCGPGEECAAVLLIYRGREFCLPLSLALRLLFDFLARHSHIPQSASQVEAAMNSDPFYTRHARNAIGKGRTRGMSRSAIKQYVRRIRLALQLTLRKAGLKVSAESILISEKTVTNEIGYRLRGNVEWIHKDLSE